MALESSDGDKAEVRQGALETPTDDPADVRVAERKERQESINLRLEGRKLLLELEELRRPYWQKAITSPGFVTSLLATIGAVFTAFMLISDHYFDIREKLNAYQAQETKRLQDDANARTAAAKVQIGTANASVAAAEASAKKRIEDAQTASALQIKTIQDTAIQHEKEIRLREDSLQLAYDVQERVRMALQADSEGTTSSDQGVIAKQMDEFKELRSSAERAWHQQPTPETKKALLAAYSVPTARVSALQIKYILGSRDSIPVWFIPNHSYFLTSEQLGELDIWYPSHPDPATLQESDRVPVPRKRPSTDSYPYLSPLGKTMAVVEKNPMDQHRYLEVWDVDKKPMSFVGELSSPAIGAISDDHRIATLDPFPKTDGSIVDPFGSHPQQRIPIHAIEPRLPGGKEPCIVTRADDIQFAPGKPFLATRWSDDAVQITDVDTGATVATLNANRCGSDHATVGKIKFSTDGKLLVEAGDSKQRALVWSTSDWKPVCEVPAEITSDGRRLISLFAALAPNSDSHLLLITSVSEVNHAPWKVTLWNDETCKPVKMLYFGTQQTRAEFTSDGSRILVNILNPLGSTTKVFDRNGAEVAELNPYCRSYGVWAMSDPRYALAVTPCGVFAYTIVAAEDTKSTPR